MTEASRTYPKSGERQLQTAEKNGSEDNVSPVSRRGYPSVTDHQIALCCRNECNKAPEFAAVFGHDRIGHAVTNTLVRQGITTAAQLRQMSDHRILNISGIGPKAFRSIREHFTSPRPEESNTHRRTDLEGPQVTGCLFCDPDRSRILCQSPGWYARFDNYPATPGHVEIVPKWHIESLFDLSAPELLDAYTLIHDVRRILAKEHNPDGWNIGVNDGAAAGRTIDHLHIHLIPRRLGDQLDPRGGIRRGLPNGDPDTWSTHADGLSARPARPAIAFSQDVASGTAGNTHAADQ